MKKKIIICILSCTALLTGCDQILDVKPRQSIDSRDALSNEAAVEAALNSVYAYLRQASQYGRDLVAIPELLADNAINTGNSGALVAEALNQPGAHINNWQSSYFAINEINNLFDALQALNASQEFKDRIAGQLYFLRALYYHNLMRIYAYDPTAIREDVNKGGVPVMRHAVRAAEQISLAAREPIHTVYEHIYHNLDSALLLLQDYSTNRAPHYATAGAAAALYTRVALYNGDYEKVLVEADNALASGVGVFQSNGAYISAWRSPVHPESMFELVYLPPDNIGVNESLRATFTSRLTLTGTTFTNRGHVVLSNELYELYKPEDVRRQLIMKGLGRNSALNEMYKFISKNGTANLDNVPVIRISEVYLNRAEAYARLGFPDEARADLNRIRTRAGLPAVEETLSGVALINEILLQRRLELAFEGHRFFDMKRLGMDIKKESGTVLFSEHRILARIPIREVQANPNLVQNDGY
ncbi:RagB/SusD family nutrient uptake outer membrane protein [Chitinophaga sp.]|uniref:RagB/SusD family nutrient uptake outer membrane protein n=1 Tax=Chitinophaga sp. TaxID=1869181 RepID=UPI0031D626D6